MIFYGQIDKTLLNNLPNESLDALAVSDGSLLKDAIFKHNYLVTNGLNKYYSSVSCYLLRGWAERFLTSKHIELAIRWKSSFQVQTVAGSLTEQM